MDAQNRSLFWSGHFPISRLMGLIPNSLWLTAQDNRRRATRPHWIHGYTSPLPHSSTKMCVWNQHKHLKVNTVTVSCSLSSRTAVPAPVYFKCENYFEGTTETVNKREIMRCNPSHPAILPSLSLSLSLSDHFLTAQLMPRVTRRPAPRWLVDTFVPWNLQFEACHCLWSKIVPSGTVSLQHSQHLSWQWIAKFLLPSYFRRQSPLLCLLAPLESASGNLW